MLILSGADVVLPGGVAACTSVLIEGDRILDVRPGRVPPATGDTHLDLSGHLVIPGFVDLHVHGVDGRDVLDGEGALPAIAAGLARFGVTSFCPTTIACPPAKLRAVFDAVRSARLAPPPRAARVLPAHLESNFISPEYCGAQPKEMLRVPGASARRAGAVPSCGCGCGRPAAGDVAEGTGEFTAEDILAVLDECRAEVGIVTLAPELEGAIDLVRRLVAGGHRVSLGHSGAAYDVSLDAIAAGATQATHLFNRMPPLGHREPGLAGAVLSDERAAVEVICDGRHVHPAMLKLVFAAKGPNRAMAITDGTAGAGLPEGGQTILGGRRITVRDSAAYLDDGTLAGSAMTFDGAFRMLVKTVGLDLADAARTCSTTPARELGLVDRGTIAPGLLADLVVLDAGLRVRHTCIAGVLAFSAD